MPVAPDVVLEDHQGRTLLRFERLLHHRPAKVWAALTELDELRPWHPSPFELEPRAGGAVRYVPPDGAAFGEGEVTEYDPPRVLAYTWGEDRLSRAGRQPRAHHSATAGREHRAQRRWRRGRIARGELERGRRGEVVRHDAAAGHRGSTQSLAGRNGAGSGVMSYGHDKGADCERGPESNGSERRGGLTRVTDERIRR